MKHLLSGTLTLSALLAAPAFAVEQTARLDVGGLTCPSCSFIVGSSLKSVDSVVIEDFVDGEDTGHGLYTIRFDDAETSVEALIEAVRKNGYSAEVLPDGSS